ncbi:MAG: putative sulfate exporter family transporter [Betaproteobacteria bacterium]|nr:putative sulfate exporter family transporter [Betaproteobacteria bacterium]MDE2132544.1 putative sulfate exporter family transporter [Betaproteobacteria bacterium]MDE2212787.1 putative sulfate exporter family transporter [Betaproteobacteria bacterium]
MSQTASLRAAPAGWRTLFQKEDWWAIWIGLGLLAAAVLLFDAGASMKWIAVTPKKWHTVDQLLLQFGDNAGRYALLFGLWAGVLGIGVYALGISLRQFLPAFLFIYVVSVLIFFLGEWDRAHEYNLEPPLVALALGLVIANLGKLPAWLESGLRVEFYIKTGIVLLGATLPFTLILWAGPVAITQATIVSLATFGTIFWTGKKLGLDRRLAATLGAGGAVCGVSASIAIAGAVGAKKEHAPISISLVVFWAIVMIFALPIVARSLGLPTGVAGAWIGTSEFADAAGLAAAQAYGGYSGNVPGVTGNPEAAVRAFTLMKVIGRDVWIGIWALVLSVVATTRWEQTGVQGRAGIGEIWRRFPKFVIGFLLASLAVTAIAQGYSFAEYKSTVEPNLVAPIKNLRTWAFIFCFFSIGLTTRLSAFTRAGAKPFYAFTLGVAVNVVLGYVLSTQVFSGFWTALGQ